LTPEEIRERMQRLNLSASAQQRGRVAQQPVAGMTIQKVKEELERLAALEDEE
jgi:hypothetical protein